MTRAPWLATVLRAAGLKVVEHAGWEKRGRDFADLGFLVWHHDASPVGDSPGVPAYMLREMAAGRAGAQLWVDRRGAWHVLAAGVAYHAGAVLPGMPSNGSSLGVECDHTTGEAWPQAQLDGLRAGTAAILARLKADAGALHFHKSICSPAGRKSDPDGLDLTAERARVRRLLTGVTAQAVVKPTPIAEEIDVSLDRAYFDSKFADLSGGPRRADKVDTNPAVISVADVYTLVEKLAAEVAALRAEVKA